MNCNRIKKLTATNLQHITHTYAGFRLLSGIWGGGELIEC